MARSKFITAQDLAVFRKSEITARSVIDGFLNGIHKSPFKGFALDFSHYREYNRGDDVKHLDWKVFARSDKFYIKQYDEFAVLKAYILLDASASMGYGSGEYTKLDYARFLAGILSHIFISQKDSVGFTTYDNEMRFFLPPINSSSQLTQIIKHLVEVEASGVTAMSNILDTLSVRMKKRGLVIIISDMFDDPDVIKGALQHFSKRRHEIVVFRILDKDERDFPFTKFTKFIDLETGADLMADPVRIRKAYTDRYQELDQSIQKACFNLAIDYIPVFTDTPPVQVLARYISMRAKRTR